VVAYRVVDGIPLLLANAGTAEHDELAHGRSHKRGQASYFDEEVTAESEIERPRGSRLQRFLIGEKFRRSLAGLPSPAPGATALSVCAGSGMDAEFLARAGYRVIAADLSLGAACRAAERARRYGLPVSSVVADVEQLPFPDRAFDLVYVHDGLHHLEDPVEALAEMTRVSSFAVSVNEPARAAVTRLAVRAGLSLEREPAGNRVARLRAEDVARGLRKAGFETVRSERYAMYYHHEPGRLSRLLGAKPIVPAVKAGWRLGNGAFGRWGNKLTVQAVRH
jgi:SAM-dependent methyltransferase